MLNDGIVRDVLGGLCVLDVECSIGKHFISQCGYEVAPTREGMIPMELNLGSEYLLALLPRLDPEDCISTNAEVTRSASS